MKHEHDLFKDVEQFLHDTPVSSTERDVLPFSEQVKDFKRRQDRILFKAGFLPEQTDLNSEYLLFRQQIDTLGNNKLAFGKILTDENDLDHVFIHSYDHIPEKSHLNLIFAPGVFEYDSLKVLQLGKHLDDATDDQVKRLLASDQIIKGSLVTLFVLSDNGGCGKISSFPRNIVDTRRDAGDMEIANKHVVSELTERDISEINNALSILERTSLSQEFI